MKKILLPGTALLTVLSLAFVSCSKTEENVITDPVPINITQGQTNLIESGNEFAFDIFERIILKAGSSENVMISPLSISYALSMSVNGAEGETREAILDALRLNGLSTDELNRSYSDLTEDLMKVDRKVIMEIANSVWTEDDFNVKKPFLDILSEYYKAEAGSFDIDDPSAPDAINEWIEEKTNGLITEMIQTLPDNTVMLLINAIYFKGQWKMQFDEKATSDMPFFRSGGGTVNVPMMKQKENFRFFQGDGFKIAEFPYGQGNFVMDVILPDEADGLTEVMARLGGSGFSSWINAMTEKELQVSFPRFKYGFRLTLKEILTDMGMGIAFTDAASFSNISEQYDLLINEVTHQSFIETNEEGTEAAAATVVEVGTTSVPVILVFNMDHPFIYIIRETTTNSIIFMGRVSDPSAN